MSNKCFQWLTMFKLVSPDLTEVLNCGSIKEQQAGGRQCLPCCIYDCLQLLLGFTPADVSRFDMDSFNSDSIFKAGTHILHCTVLLEPFSDF